MLFLIQYAQLSLKNINNFVLTHTHCIPAILDVLKKHIDVLIGIIFVLLIIIIVKGMWFTN